MPSRMANRNSDAVSGASSDVALSKAFGTASFAIVRNDWKYWWASEPVV